VTMRPPLCIGGKFGGNRTRPMDEKVEKLLNWIRQSPTVTHDRFFVLASEYGINRALASDLWFLRHEQQADPNQRKLFEC
jgi:hypothetical protein